MNEQRGSARGILTAAAIVMMALMILLDELRPFSATFTLEMIPPALRRRIEGRYEGFIVTATVIKKRQIGERFTQPVDTRPVRREDE